jgi:hypothetical protein
MTSRFVLSLAIALATSIEGAAQPPPPPGQGSPGAPRPMPPEPLEARPAPPGPIVVPEGDGAPVITDGLFSPGEWDDAVRTPVGNSVALHLKRWRDVVYVGVRGEDVVGVGPSELCLAVPGGPVLKLHVSSQLYEVVLPAVGDEPAPRMGLTTGWYANEQRRDVALMERMQKEGRSPLEATRAGRYPSDGIEFAIRRAKLPGDRWLLRLYASATDAGRPGMLTWPAGTAERVTTGWAEVKLN